MNSAIRTRFTGFSAPLVALLHFVAPAAVSASADAANSTTVADPTMPVMLRLALIQSRAGEVGSEYHIADNGRGANPRHGLTLAFNSAGVRIEGGDGRFALRLERFGRGAGRSVRRAAPRVDGAWIEYDRGAGLTEWFVNLPRGVEQGWTVTERPAGGGPLVLELDTTRPPDESDNRRLAWSGLVYHRLVALDADGRELPATWTHDGSRLRIEVDDHDATYPLSIDPWVQQAKLVADDGAAEDRFGRSVALAGDTALVGAEGAEVGGNNQQGAAYIFTRSNGVWSQQAKLTAADGAAEDQFGVSVALVDGTALVGAFLADVESNQNEGAVYVFSRSGGVWSQQAKLTAADGAAEDQFGVSVALAGDSALVGAWLAEGDGNSSQGAAYVFHRSGQVWSQQAKLTAADGAVGDNFGVSVALAGDSALVGARFGAGGRHINQGAAYVFTRNGEVWSQQAKLTAADGAGSDFFGDSVALAGDTALVGAHQVTVDGQLVHGAAYVFSRSDGVWSQQAKLTPADGAAFDRFGLSVALTGNTALVGAPGDDVSGNFDLGAAYFFTRSGDLWNQQAKLAADDGMAGDLFGGSVALANDAALMGALFADVGDNVDHGAVYDFAPPLTPAALAVDLEPMASGDGNEVFEPGEVVDVAPGWRNNGTAPLGLTGTASGFTGPPGADYTLEEGGADYGTLDPGQIASCLDTGSCYVMGLDDPSRPVPHWDANFDETLDDPDGTAKNWTLHIGDSFTDVPRTHLFYSWIETVLHLGVTTGCGGTEYCPTGTSTRGQMPVFVLRASLGPEFTPEPCVEGQERFDDVLAGNLFCPWIEELAERGVIQGCGNGNYCPSKPVTRAQMAVFLLKTLEGPNFIPPECEGVFADVPCPSTFADWVEELYNRGVTSGCTIEPLNYCPGATNIRGQMAVFLAKTFGLTLYGP